MLGFVYIVKNEEANIRKSLESIKGLADEIVIVDTGSTDKTKEIAKEYTDKVFDFVWQDDFAQARNFSIEKSESEWLLWLDGDEEIKDKDILEKWKTEEKKFKCYRLPLVNFVLDKPQNMFWTIKLFRREFRFVRPIHEGINVENPEDIGSIPATIYHWGYNKLDDDVKQRRFERNLQLLLKQRETDKGKYNTFHLGSTYYYIKDYENAILYFKEIIDTIGTKPAPFEKEAVTYCADSLYKLGKYDEAVNMAKLLKKIEPNNVKAYYIKAMALAHKGKFEKAVEEVGDALEHLKTPPWKVSTYNYVDYSFPEWACRLGAVHYMQGKYMQSLACYKEALTRDPANESVQRNILKNLWRMGAKPEFMAFYKKYKTPNIPQEILGEMLK